MIIRDGRRIVIACGDIKDARRAERRALISIAVCFVLLVLLGVKFDRDSRARIARWEAEITADYEAERARRADIDRVLAKARERYEYKENTEC